MKRGRLKKFDLPIRVDEISSDIQRTFDGELNWGVSVTERSQTASGHEFAKGRAALRKEVERDVARVGEDDDSVRINPTVQHNHVTEIGQWLAIDDGWLIVSDEWVAGVVSQQLSGHPKDVTLRLQGLLEVLDEPNVWQMGFAGRTVAEGGSKGTLYGDNVHEDPDLGEELRHTPLNELGVEHINEGIPVKSYFAAGTGYIEVYDSEFSTREFADYCCHWVVDHVSGEDEDEAEAGDSELSEDAEDDGEVLKCENADCERESDSVQKTVVDDNEVMQLCVVCRNHYYETGEVPA